MINLECRLACIFLLLILGCSHPEAPKEPVQANVSSNADTQLVSEVAPIDINQPFIIDYAHDGAVLYLIHWGDGVVDGHWQENGKDETVYLYGDMNPSGRFLLEQYRGTTTIATLSGTIDEHKLQGVWGSSTESDTSFYMLRNPTSQDTYQWAGNWILSNAENSGQLIIGCVTDHDFHMALSVVNDGSAGEMTARAEYKEVKAAINSVIIENFGACQMTLLRQGDAIILEQQSLPFDCGFGAHAIADGRYQRADKLMPK